MLTKRLVAKWGFLISLVLLGLLLGLYLGSPRMEAAQAAVEGQTSERPTASENILAEHQCVPENVAVFPNRIHIKCATSAPGGISYFALATDDSKHTARVLSLLLTAKASSLRVAINYDPNDLSGAAISCLTSDCRLIRWAAMIN